MIGRTHICWPLPNGLYTGLGIIICEFVTFIGKTNLARKAGKCLKCWSSYVEAMDKVCRSTEIKRAVIVLCN